MSEPTNRIESAGPSWIVGTAGHIDHGKTALVRALTGIDTDRLKEEKERGISIDLGFAFLDLDGMRVGIIDVPGHERFIRNMLAGAHGIDLVLLVVAADDGVMPQTEEHLDIVHLLGVQRAVVALTKSDLASEDRLGAVEEEIEILLSGTTLEGSPVVRVSSLTGDGIEALCQTLTAQLSSLTRTPRSGAFRMPIDRVFTLHGHGTVVTGTAISGSVAPGDLLTVVPGEIAARVRSVHVHDREVASASVGQRVALNLGGVQREQLRRGLVVCATSIARITSCFDVWLEVRPGAGKSIANHQAIRLHTGSIEALGKVVLLGRDELPARSAGLAQIVLRYPVHVLRSDRFVVRSETAQRTIAGGWVIHPFARRHRRAQNDTLIRLEELRRAQTPDELLRALIGYQRERAVAIDDIRLATGLNDADWLTSARVDNHLHLLPNAEDPVVCLTTDNWNALTSAIVDHVSQSHREQQLSAGVEMESLRSKVAPDLAPKVFRAVVDRMVSDKLIARDESTLRLPGHRVALPSNDQALAEKVERLLAEKEFTPPSVAEIESLLILERKAVQALLRQLERERRVAKLDENLYFAAAPLERARTLLSEHVAKNGQINAAEFRDLLGASRKFSIGLLDYFDRTGFTMRVGDARKLRK